MIARLDEAHGGHGLDRVVRVRTPGRLAGRRRLLRLVRGGDQAAAVRPGPDACDGPRAARAAAGLPPSGDAARDRGDLDALPDRANRLMPWPEPDETQPRFEEIRNAAEILRRSGAIVGSTRSNAGSSKRSSSPTASATATSPSRSSAFATRSRGPKACSATSASWRGLPRTSSRPSARSSLATAVSSKLSAASADSATDWVASLSPWPEEFGLDRMRELLDRLGHPERRYPAIHVVGTNGKSTATRTIAALLHARGGERALIRRRT